MDNGKYAEIKALEWGIMRNALASQSVSVCFYILISVAKATGSSSGVPSEPEGRLLG